MAQNLKSAYMMARNFNSRSFVLFNSWLPYTLPRQRILGFDPWIIFNPPPPGGAPARWGFLGPDNSPRTCLHPRKPGGSRACEDCFLFEDFLALFFLFLKSFWPLFCQEGRGGVGISLHVNYIWVTGFLSVAVNYRARTSFFFKDHISAKSTKITTVLTSLLGDLPLTIKSCTNW